MSAEAGVVLRKHAWPGNVRELRNVITKTAVMAMAAEITGEALAAELRHPPAASVQRAVAIDADTAGPDPDNLAETANRADPANLSGVERRMILKVLGQTKGHQQRAAELLGISRRTLSRKLKSYETKKERRSCAS